ncbi:ATP-binding protein [Lactococcus muris]|uniref:ATP-binding protein n=2 Tax=Lactococcus TaxID=1357 RepID=A0ABV4DCQ0_9LACT|nr:hypothetical protein [Lactococcus garvieae]
MKLKNDIVAIHNNLALKESGEVVAFYEVPSSVVSQVDQEARIKSVGVTFDTLAALYPQKQFNILNLPFPLDLLPKFELLSQDFAEDTSDLAYEISNIMLNKLDMEFEDKFEYKSFVLVPLKNKIIAKDIRKAFKMAFEDFKEQTLRVLNLKTDFELDWFKEYERLNFNMERTLAYLSAEPLTELQTAIILKHPYTRGLDLRLEFEGAKVLNSIENIDDREVRFEGGVAILERGELKSFSKTLPIAYYPNNVEGLYLLDFLKTFIFPIETNFHVAFSNMKGLNSVASKGRRARKNLKNAMVEAYEQDSVQKSSVIDSKDMLDVMEDQVDAKELFVEFNCLMTLSAKSMEELEDRENQLIERLSAFEIEVSTGGGEQISLFFRNRPTEFLSIVDKNYRQPATLEAFCEHLFFVDTRLGESVGFYTGRIDNQISSWRGDYRKALSNSSNLIFSNLFLANKLDIKGKTTNNSHVAVIGETGSGKSFFTKQQFLYASLLKSKVLYIDPKMEVRRQFEQVKREFLEDENPSDLRKALIKYIDTINFVTLNAEDKRNQGVLDPLVFLMDDTACYDLAENIIDELAEVSQDFLTAFKNAMDIFLAKRSSGERVGMKHVFDYLVEHGDKEVKSTAQFLLSMSDGTLVSLVFSYGQNGSVSLKERITILEISGLDLPNKGDLPTSYQKKSLAVMYALGYFCTEFGKRERNVETVEFFDEAWFFNSSDIGRGILKRMKRVGRSENNTLFYITQSIHDIVTEDDTTSFGKVFAFLEKSEVEDVLKYLKIPVNETTILWMSNMTMGQCIYLDVFSRVARMTVDGLDQDIMKLYNTVDTMLKSVA